MIGELSTLVFSESEDTTMVDSAIVTFRAFFIPKLDRYKKLSLNPKEMSKK